MSKVEALSPKDVVGYKKASIPDVVLEVFNEMITEKFNGSRATVYQGEAVKRMVDRGLDRGEIFDKGWLDVEDIFRAKGWKVDYDKPGFNETYEAYFVFSPKRSKSR